MLISPFLLCILVMWEFGECIGFVCGFGDVSIIGQLLNSTIFNIILNLKSRNYGIKSMLPASDQKAEEWCLSQLIVSCFFFNMKMSPLFVPFAWTFRKTMFWQCPKSKQTLTYFNVIFYFFTCSLTSCSYFYMLKKFLKISVYFEIHSFLEQLTPFSINYILIEKNQLCQDIPNERNIKQKSMYLSQMSET